MPAEFPNIHVLLVEDDEVSIYVMEKILSKKFKVKVARNGVEALHMVENQEFDVILMDIGLRHSLDGFEVLTELRNNKIADRTKVFATTGMAVPEDREQFISRGFDDFFAKPLNHHDLAQRIIESCLVKTY